MSSHINWKYFVLGVITVVIVCLFTGIEYVNGRAVSIMEILYMGYEDARLRVTWQNAFSVVMYGNLYFVLPLITSTATAPLICDELRTNNYQFQFCRIGIKRFIHQRFLVSILCSMGILLIGFLIFGIFVFCNFPSVPDFGGAIAIGFEPLSNWEMLKKAFIQGGFMLCYGGMLAVFSCNLVSITQNIYVILCIPFVVNYVVAPYLRNCGAVFMVGILALLYFIGYYMWKWRYQGVRA